MSCSSRALDLGPGGSCIKDRKSADRVPERSVGVPFSQELTTLSLISPGPLCPLGSFARLPFSQKEQGKES